MFIDLNKTRMYVRVRELLLSLERNKYHMSLCLCMRAWARPCVRVRAALLTQHARRMRHTVSFVAPLAPPYFSTFSHKWHDFRVNATEHEMYF